MKEEIKNNIYLLSPNGVTTIACVPQAHVAVVLCKHNPTDIHKIKEAFIKKIF